MGTEEIDENSGSSLSGLGERIRTLRAQRQMTLQDLSNISQVSVAMLSHIERGRSTPSIKVLDRIRLALKVPFSVFFGEATAPTPEEDRHVVARQGERPVLTFETTGLAKELLSPRRGTRMEMMLLHLDANGHSGDEPWRRVGEKCGMVLEGSLEITIGTTRYVARQGDAFQFDSSIPHSFRNLHDGKTRVMWIIYSTEMG